MSNVTVQEALKAAVAAMETCKSHRYEGREANVFSQWFDEKLIAKSLDECKAALSDIEKREPVALVALNNAALQKRIEVLEDLLTSAAAIAIRSGEGTHWERFIGQLKVNGIGNITAKTFRVLPSDEGYTSPISKECEPINEVYAFEKWLKENTLIRASLNIDLDYADPLAEIAYRAWKARAKLNTEKGWL